MKNYNSITVSDLRAAAKHNGCVFKATNVRLGNKQGYALFDRLTGIRKTNSATLAYWRDQYYNGSFSNHCN